MSLDLFGPDLHYTPEYTHNTNKHATEPPDLHTTTCLLTEKKAGTLLHAHRRDPARALTLTSPSGATRPRMMPQAFGRILTPSSGYPRRVIQGDHNPGQYRGDLNRGQYPRSSFAMASASRIFFISSFNSRSSGVCAFAPNASSRDWSTEMASSWEWPPRVRSPRPIARVR